MRESPLLSSSHLEESNRSVVSVRMWQQEQGGAHWGINVLSTA